MKSIWSFLNSPLIVAGLSILVVTAMIKSCSRDFLPLFGSSERTRREVEALGRLQLLSFNEVEVSTNAPQKFVGTLRKNSRFILERIEGTVCFYNESGRLIDIISNRLSGLGAIAPGESREFYVERPGTDGSAALTKKVKGTVKTEMKFVSVDVVVEK